MKSPDNLVFRIGAWRVDPALDEISKGNETVKLEPQTMRLLVCLAEHAGGVVSVEQLLDQVWKDVIVTPNSVYHAVATLRRILGCDAKNPTYIANILRRGYRLVTPVVPWVDAPSVPSADSSAAAAEVSPLPNTSAMTGPMTDRSIAVLPFVDMSEKQDQGYFADGMAEEVVNLLTRVPGIRVIGRTACSQFKGKSEDLRRIGSVLGAAYAVEGSVRRSGNRLRVTAQLIGTQDGSHLWSGSYDRDFDEVFKIQDQIAAGLVRALQVAVGVDLPSRPILKNAVGYDLYLRGRHALDRLDKVGFESAAGYFEQALALDPTALRAAESLALVHIYIAEWGYVPPREGFERARTLCERVLELDPMSGMAHAQLGFISAIYDWNWAAAVGAVERALALDPRDPGILVTAGIIHLALDRLDEAAGFFNAASALDPLGAVSHGELGTIYYRSGRLAEAEAEFRRALEISPTFQWAHWSLGTVLLTAGRLDAALSQMQQSTPDCGGDAGLALVYHAMKRAAESDAALARATKADAGRWAYGIAEVHAYRGEIDQAFTWLDRAYRQKDVVLYRIKGNPLLKNLEPDARYKTFLRKMKLPE
ncbi:MAG: Tetratricopeptide 2 repeat protein [Gammaproteobacteria bacterium]|nr:Tetratricopeptide 2 repeat protein [Gammaproteobacteria bacterium]